MVASSSASLALVLALIFGVLSSSTTAQCVSFPQLPFTRALVAQSPPLTGTDVLILQNLLLQGGYAVSADGVFGPATAAAVSAFQSNASLPRSGGLDAATACAALSLLSGDGYVDDGEAPGALGYLYKVLVSVHANRSVESTASLIAANGSVVYTFTARLHGADALPPAPWPSFNSSGPGLNMFTSDGDTPTGLIAFDLNTPEDNATEFGPWPVNRAVAGIRGNAAWLIPNVRDGILLHTGNWSEAGWAPPQPMPNSAGCIHAYPDSIYNIWQILLQLGVVAHPNTDGKLPYPYKPQGLLSIQQVSEGARG